MTSSKTSAALLLILPIVILLPLVSLVLASDDTSTPVKAAVSVVFAAVVLGLLGWAGATYQKGRE